jgi:RNA polymerase sigma-70 factor (ECF subfamily)
MDEKTQIDRETVEAAQEGDPEAFRQLVNAHQVAVRAFITSRLRDPMEAYDLTQDVFVTAYGKLGDFDSTRPLRPWLMGIAFNFVRRYIERVRRAPVPVGDEVLELLDQHIDQDLDVWRDVPALDALQSCLKKLSEEARHLVQRRYYEGHDIQDLREELGEKHSAVTMKLHRIRMQLQRCIERSLAQPEIQA